MILIKIGEGESKQGRYISLWKLTIISLKKYSVFHVVIK